MFTSTCANRFIEVSHGERWTQLWVYYGIFPNLHYFWLRRCRKVQRMRDVDGLGLRKRNVKEGALSHYTNDSANRKRDERRVLLIYQVWKRIRIRARVCTFSTLFVYRTSPAHTVFNRKGVPVNRSPTAKVWQRVGQPSERERLNLERRWYTAKSPPRPLPPEDDVTFRETKESPAAPASASRPVAAAEPPAEPGCGGSHGGARLTPTVGTAGRRQGAAGRREGARQGAAGFGHPQNGLGGNSSPFSEPFFLCPFWASECFSGKLYVATEGFIAISSFISTQ